MLKAVCVKFPHPRRSCRRLRVSFPASSHISIHNSSEKHNSAGHRQKNLIFQGEKKVEMPVIGPFSRHPSRSTTNVTLISDCAQRYHAHRYIITFQSAENRPSMSPLNAAGFRRQHRNIAYPSPPQHSATFQLSKNLKSNHPQNREVRENVTRTSAMTSTLLSYLAKSRRPGQEIVHHQAFASREW